MGGGFPLDIGFCHFPPLFCASRKRRGKKAVALGNLELHSVTADIGFICLREISNMRQREK